MHYKLFLLGGADLSNLGFFLFVFKEELGDIDAMNSVANYSM